VSRRPADGVPVGYENPDALLKRLKLGREEFCQRLLTALILGGPAHHARQERR
jgi:hypothetical protein